MALALGDNVARPSKRTISAVFDLVRRGRLKDATRTASAGGFDAFAAFLDSVRLVHAKDRSAAKAWATSRDKLLRRHGGEVQLAAVPFRDAQQAEETLAGFSFSGSVKPVPNDASFQFVTESSAWNSVARLPVARGGSSLLISIVLEVRTAVDENFSFELEFEDGSFERLLSMRDGGFTVCEEITATWTTRQEPLLFTFAIEPDRLHVYANGILCWRNVWRRRADVRSILFSLIGVEAATDGVMLRGIDIASFDRRFGGLVEDEEALYQALARMLLRERRAPEFWMLHQALADLPLAGMEEDLLSLLGELVADAHGFREWLYADVCKAVPEASAMLIPPPPEPIIKVEDVTAMFSTHPGEEFALSRLLTFRKAEEFPVLERIDFRVYPGDIVGIIGRNGAGKTTLLRALVGALPIRTGRISMHGRAMLLRPGLGMREELSGRDNIFSAALYMGLNRQQINAVIEEVIDFSELGEAIDRPIRYYSDGMRSRLIFSMATAISPEILLLDELLGAGDIGFRDKAARRLEAFLGGAKAVVVVTHGLSWVREKCNKALFMSHGRIVYFGNPETACSRYLLELHREYGRSPVVSLDDEEQMIRGQ
jgi:ABC-type polysaccharide/polyol phosphate transport system ATPase subunit